ncbi:hypothetical protein [Cecembia rubra]|uniref:Uncharacterized protein n=1 Tax=Cecembia rubra TaxID=1485585 RepID=A0A2P8DRL3_9BACT|nr:hypothetical protein [Cecembia rubra]PSK99824.1 hypothetical protein CLV48_11614 [Cecembia rubra]
MESKVKFKDLLKIAVEELKDLTTVENPDFRLEQAEFNESLGEWDIIVSYLIDNSSEGQNILNLTRSTNYRTFKRIKINSRKEVMGFYIFEN